ncbi:MAG: histidinol dehydrogenase [Candidatus Cryptobacteroides sp.]
MPIERYIEPSRSRWPEITRRAMEDDSDIEASVREILDAVRRGGDSALIEYENRFDRAGFACGGDLKVGEEEFLRAESLVPDELKASISAALENIRLFHSAQMPPTVDLETSPGVRCIRKAVPLRRVGLYVPGGRAPLFSTVLMLAVPAKVAGCSEIVLCTPPGPDGKANPVILWTARLCGVTEIYKTGGAQAVAAMGFGTGTIRRCDKIFGPGNRYVMKAKQMLGLTTTAIDMPAGPSEVMVIADSSASPDFVASDFLSQAEHGPDSQSVLLCGSTEVADAVEKAVESQCRSLSRSEIIGKSLSNSRIIILEKLDDIVDFANEYAPEHLIVSTEDPWSVVDRIYAAGSVFVGNYSPESAGDYASGTNHTLPTSGWARSFSGLNLDSFMRNMTIQEISREGLEALGDTIVTMARAEGLDAHAAAVQVRLGMQSKGTGQ